MKKVNIIKKNEEFSRILKTIRPIKTEFFKIYIEDTKDQTYHFGFSVSKKHGNAVFRNKVRRQIKNILDKKNYKKGFNCIIMVKESIKDNSFEKIEFDLLNGIKICKIEEENENK